jgi:uncharacterized OB-fold protein
MTMSDWSKVQRPIPVPTPLSQPFWDGAKQEKILFQHCQTCGNWQHPPAPTCRNCVGVDLKFEPIEGKGTIYSYTVGFHGGDRRFAAAIPYASIVVELDGTPGVLMAGNLLDVPYTEAHIGRRVKVVFEPLTDDITLPQFKLDE